MERWDDSLDANVTCLPIPILNTYDLRGDLNRFLRTCNFQNWEVGPRLLISDKNKYFMGGDLNCGIDIMIKIMYFSARVSQPRLCFSSLFQITRQKLLDKEIIILRLPVYPSSVGSIKCPKLLTQSTSQVYY